MKMIAIFLLVMVSVCGLLFIGAVNPPEAKAVPSYARQTGLPCSGCHYTPPELNPAGRRFKLTGYVDRADETKVVKSDGSKKRAALDLLASLPLSVMLDTSYTSTKSPIPTTQNGSFQMPQDISLFLSGAWTSHVGSFVQVTYDTQDDHFTMDNTDIRFANTTKLGGKEFVYGLDLNNNPTVEDLWNTTPAWSYPWIASDWRRRRTPRRSSMAAWRKMLAASVGMECGTTTCISTRPFIAPNTSALLSLSTETGPTPFAVWHRIGA